MSASESNRSEVPPHTPSREELAVAPTQALLPDEPSSKLVTLLDAYLAELQAGRRPDRQQLLAEHPELAAQLEQCLSGIEFIHRASVVRPSSESLGQLGDFRIIREVGRGGMGVVYEAEQVSLKRRIALKVLRYGAAADSEAMQRFQREAETVATLHHTNIVPIFAIGCENGVNYYAMQFIEGRSLAECTSLSSFESFSSFPKDKKDSKDQRQPQVGTSAIANWGLQAAEALAHAHHRGVIHRDIKPSNLILDPDGRIWLTDFGLAKRMDDVSLSMAGAILGTPRYMSPEQAAASKNPVDHRTDIYSLGATLYELATGRPLFEGDSPHAVITQILTAEPPTPRVVRPNLHRDFETIILKCLAKEPERRYATAQALADDLRAFVEGRAIKARRSTLVEQAARWFKQQKRSVGIAAAAVAATIFVVVGSLIAWQIHGQAKLGYVTLNTPREGDQRAEVAEVLSLNDEPVGSPFTLPTKEPVALPEGAYRLRLTAPGKVSQTYLFDVAAGSQQTHEVGLANETVGYPIALRSPVGAEVSGTALAAGGYESPAASAVPLSAVEPRLFIGPQDSGKPTLRCYSPNSQPSANSDGSRGKEVAPLWEANWSVESPDIISFLKLPEDREAWKVLPAQWDVSAWQQMLSWFDPWWFRNGAPPQIIFPARDLNDDGVEDVIWAAPRQLNPFSTNFGAGPLTPKAAVLMAASGKDGKPLWWFRPQDAEGNASRLLSPPVVCGSLLVMALRSTGTGEVWVESVDALSGESRWRTERIAVTPQSSVWISPLTTSGGVSEVFVVGGTKLLVLDLQTGTPRPGFRSPSTSGTDNSNQQLLRENEPILDARFGDLDGDGTNEVLLTVMSSDRGIRDMAFSVTQNKMLWEVPSSFEVGAWHQNEARHSWPLLADLNGDNKLEVILPGVRESGSIVADGCRALDGMTGEPRWTRRFPRRAGFSHHVPEQFAVGPDLNGDGHSELVMVTVRRELQMQVAHQSVGYQREQYFLYVDCFSGRDGKSVWWQRIPFGMSEFSTWTGTPEAPLWWGGRGTLGEPEGVSPRTDGATGKVRGLTPSGSPKDSFNGLKLVLPVRRHADQGGDGIGNAGARLLFVLSAETGRVEHLAEDLAFPQIVDWNNDGLDDLAVFAPDDPQRFAHAHSHPDPTSGKFVVLRGSPPEAFRRLDRWAEEQDFDGDGIAELSQKYHGHGDYAIQIASGRDGRILSKWKTEWPETPHSYTVGDVQSFPLPLGDFDGDGLADLLVLREGYNWDFERVPLVKTGQAPLLMQTISSKSGKRIWGGVPLPLPDWLRPTNADENSEEWKQSRNGRLQPVSTQAVDLDGDGRPEVLQALRLVGYRRSEQVGGSASEHQQPFVALIDGRAGTLRWLEPIAEITAGSHSPGLDYLRIDASTDLNGDGTRDLVLTVPQQSPQGSWSVSLQVQNGRDGKVLWGPKPLEGASFNNNDFNPPIISDLDGDGRPEIVLMPSKQPQVTVLRGDNGEPLWTWQGSQPQHYAAPGITVVASRLGLRPDPDRVAPSDRAVGTESQPTQRCVAVAFNETGSQWELVVLDHTGKVIERGPYPTNQLWSHDLDGDGGEELLRYVGNKLTATRGLHDVLWTWSPPSFDYVHVTRFDRTAEGRTIVVTASGDSLTLLDGPTGKPLGRSWKSTNTSLHENNRLIDLNHANIATPFENSRLLTRVGDGPQALNHVVSRAVLPTDENGRYQQRSARVSDPAAAPTEGLPNRQGDLRSAKVARSETGHSAGDDPRLIRQLPWVPTPSGWSSSYWILVLMQLSRAILLSLFVVLIPFWLIRAGVCRREFGWWRGALICAGLTVATLSVGSVVSLSSRSGVRDMPWGAQLAMAFVALPILAWPTEFLKSVFRAEWRRVRWLLGGSVLAAIALAVILLATESASLSPEQHYSLHGWWFILFFGAFAVGAMLLVWRGIGPHVSKLWNFSRRKLARHG